MTRIRKVVPSWRLAWSAALIFILVGLGGCGAVVDATTRTANANFDRQEAKRTNSIYDQSLARYQAMADRGEAKGLYYMAVVHAMKQRKKAIGEEDVVGIVDRYEKAISAGSNDARAALGEMLINGHSTPFGDTLWRPPHDPARGLDLLKTAATNSCSYTQPFMSIGRCRERESSIAAILMVRFRDGHYGVAKDPEQEAFWRDRMNACEPIIEEINRRTGCDKPF